MNKLDRSFFQQDAEQLAHALIGAVLVHRVSGKEYRARIVETEAYVGSHDLACHASKGRTKRTEVLFGPAGHAYVYLIYGIYELFNIVAGKKETGQAVLVRAAESLSDPSSDLSGPGKFTKGLKITRRNNGMKVFGKELFLLADPDARRRIERSKRIGVEYAGKWKDALLRFYDATSPAVSRRKSAAGEGRK